MRFLVIAQNSDKDQPWFTQFFWRRCEAWAKFLYYINHYPEDLITISEVLDRHQKGE